MSNVDREILLQQIRIKNDVFSAAGNKDFYDKVLNNQDLFDEEVFNKAQQIEMFKGKTIPFKLLSNNETMLKFELKRYMNFVRFVGQTIIHQAFNELHAPDNTEITRWKEGASMSPHSDNSWVDGNQLDHPTRFRTWSGIYYINDDYKGGEIYFPELNWEFKPTADTLLIFPSSSKYIHGVKTVSKGTRFTVAAWYTNDYGYLEI